MKKLLLQTLSCVLLVIVMCACSKKEATTGFLNEMSGVWRAKSDGAMVSLVYSDKAMRMFIGEDPIPVTLGDIDNVNNTVNLNITGADGKPGVWTVRQIWDKEHKSFHLQITLHDGTQDELSFVRKISTDDMNRFANAEGQKGGAISDAVRTSNAPEPVIVAGSVPDATLQNQSNSQASWAPSFDCAKVNSGPERLICSNQELSAADVQLAQIYKAALSRSTDKGALKQEQAAWLKNERNACSDAQSMLLVYQARIAELSL